MLCRNLNSALGYVNSIVKETETESQKAARLLDGRCEEQRNRIKKCSTMLELTKCCPDLVFVDHEEQRIGCILCNKAFQVFELRRDRKNAIRFDRPRAGLFTGRGTPQSDKNERRTHREVIQDLKDNSNLLRNSKYKFAVGIYFPAKE